MDKHTNEELVEIAENEGLGYMVMHYTSPDSCEDEETKKLFTEARDALNKLAKHIRSENT